MYIFFPYVKYNRDNPYYWHHLMLLGRWMYKYLAWLHIPKRLVSTNQSCIIENGGMSWWKYIISG